MLAQRRRTFRSHPSCSFPEVEDASSKEVLEVLGKPFSRLLQYAGLEEGWRKILFSQYFADMLRTLRGCSRLLRQDGRIIIIIGNSLHGSSGRPIPIATDVWTSKLAPAAGLKLEKILI